MNNPFDNSAKLDFDLPPEGLDEEEERELAVGEDQREQALRQKSAGSALTESRGYAMLAEFAEQQKTAILNMLLCTTITDANKDDFNLLRGQAIGLQIALRFARAISEGAAATIELLNEARKNDAVDQAESRLGTRH